MNITETLIQEYAKKIYGFAYAKTNHYHDAQDLSADIILALCANKWPEKQIDNMDAYIYRICEYTWSKFLRRNKRQWEALNNNTVIETIESEKDIEGDFIKQELYRKLRQEIMYLNKSRREITILYYYDNKSGDEIAQILGIPAATVRWHLFRTKNELKERIMITENDQIYRPVRLCIGHYGWYENDIMRELETDVLMQNICYVCYGKAMTIEEISRTLGVAAVYLEDKIEKLLYMEYMKEVGSNKYQTNFFIEDAAYWIARKKYVYHNTMPLAFEFYCVMKEALPEIRKLSFLGSDREENTLLWNLLPFLLMMKIGEIDNKVIRECKLEHGAPIRKDGTKHWVGAQVPPKEGLKSIAEIDPKLYDFCVNGNGCGIKTRGTGKISSIQFDINLVGGFREFDSKDLLQLKRVKDIICSGDEPNSYDKEVIAELVKKGYVSTRGERLEILIPYFSADQINRVRDILKNHMVAMKDIEKTFYEYVEHMKKYIPSFIDSNERNHLLTSYSPHYAILWHLMNEGYLKEPTTEEKKCICTMVWEEE